MLVFNQETYPNFPVPYKTTITRLVGHFYESGSVDDIPGLCDFWIAVFRVIIVILSNYSISFSSLF